MLWSCAGNVVWLDPVTAARAMLKLSRNYDEVMKDSSTEKTTEVKALESTDPEKMETEHADSEYDLVILTF